MWIHHSHNPEQIHFTLNYLFLWVLSLPTRTWIRSSRLSLFTHTTCSHGGRVFIGICLCVCLSAVYSLSISKTDADRITKRDIEIFHCESWKPIYLGVKRSKIKVTKHKNRMGVVFALLWVLAFSGLVLSCYFFYSRLSGLPSAIGYTSVYWITWSHIACAGRWTTTS